MTQPAKSQEPSMEEILASIRRIIADDDASKTPQRTEEPPRASAWPAAPSLEEQASDILDLAEPVAAPSFSQPEPAAIQTSMPSPVPAPQFRKIEGYSDENFDEAEQTPAMHEPAEASGADEREQLLSNTTSAAVDSAFNMLAQAVLVQNGRTLEDLVREMLRPMLKSWLDDNLPGLVERLVRTEIERVARGR